MFLNKTVVGCLLFPLFLGSCATAKVDFGSGATASSGAPFQTVPLVGTYQAKRYTLDNGLKLVVVENHSSPTFAYHTWFKVGSRNERPLATGLAHFFEHMMFKGTTKHPEGEFDKILERAGVEGENAFTSQDYTAYIQELPKQHLELIMNLESDRMVNLVINDQSFSTEREVVKNELHFRTANSPDGLMYEKLFDLSFTKHPYHWPVIGYEEDLNRMTTQDAQNWYKTYYHPSNATVVISGDVDPDQVFELVKTYYGNIERRAVPPAVTEVDPPLAAPKRKTMKFDIQTEKLMMAYRIPSIASADLPALELLQGVLTDGKSSRLDRALVETGVATGVYSGGYQSVDPGIFLLGAEIQKGQRAATAESVILSELDKLSRILVSERELTRVKNLLDFGFYGRFQNNMSLADFVGRYETSAPGVEFGIELQKAILKTTAEDLRRVVQTYFKPQSRVVVTGVKK